IIVLKTGSYGERGRAMLFLITIVVIALVVIQLLRWINHLISLGRVGTTIDRVEAATSAALTERQEQPYLGANPWFDLSAGRRHAGPRPNDRLHPVHRYPGYCPSVRGGGVRSLSAAQSRHLRIRGYRAGLAGCSRWAGFRADGQGGGPFHYRDQSQLRSGSAVRSGSHG